MLDLAGGLGAMLLGSVVVTQDVKMWLIGKAWL